MHKGLMNIYLVHIWKKNVVSSASTSAMAVICILTEHENDFLKPNSVNLKI